MTDLLRYIASIIPLLQEGNLQSIVAQNGGAGLCGDVSEGLKKYFPNGEVYNIEFPTADRPLQVKNEAGEIQPLERFLPLIKIYKRKGGSNNHYVFVWCNTYVIDLTGRQFGTHVPFPLIKVLK